MNLYDNYDKNVLHQLISQPETDNSSVGDEVCVVCRSPKVWEDNDILFCEGKDCNVAVSHFLEIKLSHVCCITYIPLCEMS